MTSTQAIYLDITAVYPNPNQPRKIFDPEKLEELAGSIKEVGLLSPIMVRPNGAGYIIVHGERRWRACKLAGLETIRAEVKEADDKEAYTLSVVENEQRENLTAIETAQSLQSMIDSEGLTQSEVARRISKSRDWVAQKLRLLKLPGDVKTVIGDTLTEGHGRQLLKLQTAGLDNQVSALAQKATAEKWPVARLESEVDMAIIGSVSRDTTPVIQQQTVTLINHATGQRFNFAGDQAARLIEYADSLLSVSRDTSGGNDE